MCKCRRLKGAAFLVVLACMLTSPHCWATTRLIYSDDFSGTGGLNGKAPDVRPGNETWIAASVYGADGTVSTNVATGVYTYQAWLPFSPAVGKTYRLSLDVDPNESTDPTTWFALGFSNSNATASSDGDDQFWTTGIGWILHRVTRAREENDEIQTFLGPGMSEDQSHESKEEGMVKLTVFLDTTGNQWTVEWFRNGQSIRGPVAFETNPKISYVGFTKFWVTGGTVDNFALSLSEEKSASVPSPYDGATDVSPEPVLTWKSGGYVAGLSPKHRVFFSRDFDDVNDGIGPVVQDLERYPIDGTMSLDMGETYFWRIDEANSTTGWDVGDVWQFTVARYIVVDDFESYDADDNQIWYAWRDGMGYGEPGVPPYSAGNGTGAEVGDGTTDSYTEQTIVNGGDKSMPYWYNNDKPGKLKYSQAKLTFGPHDWTRKDVRALSLWFRGYPAYLGGFAEEPPGSYTMLAGGADISDESDQFHFAWQQLNGPGSIIAKVESVRDTNPRAKAGVMIRDTLDADSAHAMVAVTPGHGVWLGRRALAAEGSTSVTQSGMAAPYWVKLERTAGGLMRAYYSVDGSSWTQLGGSVAINMSLPMYIGLALTSRSPGVQCEAKFSNVTSDGAGQWVNQDIGMLRNVAEPMYVAISNTNGTAGTLYHVDPNATVTDTWTEWNIDLTDFAGRGVDLTDVNSIAIGFGDRDDPQAGGAGKMYFDDIRLYPPRCVPSLLKPAGDLNNDCVVDCLDLEMMASDWLQGDYAVAATVPEPAVSWWKFDNNSADSAGPNHGITRGDPTYAGGKFGQAIDLDGDDYVDCGNPESLDFGTGDWTISAWIRTSQSGTGDENKGTVFANGADQTDGIRYTLALNEVTSGRITLTTDDNSSKVQATSSVSVNDDAWHHVAGTRNGTELLVYVDGVLEGTNTVAAAYDLSGTSQHKAYIGAITDNRDNSLIKYFTGSIDDVRIYDYALSDTDLIGLRGLTELYYPLTSPANIWDEEPNKSKKVNFKDFAVLADEWLEQFIWPEQ